MLREMPRRVPAPPRITRSNCHDRSSARVGASLAEGHARSPHRAPDPLAPEGEAGNPSPHNEGSMRHASSVVGEYAIQIGPTQGRGSV